MPKLSIIIPTFNSAAAIGRCLHSISSQTFSDYEVLVQDGGSSDSTVDLIRTFQEVHAGIKIEVRQERDEGVYDAMNKAMLRAEGEWLYFLGSDDEIYDENVLNRMMRSREATDSDVLYGNVLMIGQMNAIHDGRIYDGPFDLAKLLSKNICHQAIFYRASFLREVGRYAAEYVVSADWDFNMRCWTKGRFTYLDMIIAKFYLGGLSTRDGGDQKFDAEVTANVMRYFNLTPSDPLVTAPEFYGNVLKRKAQEARGAAGITPHRIWMAIVRRFNLASKLITRQ